MGLTDIGDGWMAELAREPTPPSPPEPDPGLRRLLTWVFVALVVVVVVAFVVVELMLRAADLR
jgi:hypothetical protein